MFRYLRYLFLAFSFFWALLEQILAPQKFCSIQIVT